MCIRDSLNAEQLAAYRAGGGESAINSGKSLQDVMQQGYNNLNSLKSKPPGTHTPEEEQALIDAGLDDFVRGGMKTTDIFGDLLTLGAAAAIVKGGVSLASNAIVQGIMSFARHAGTTYGTAKTAEAISDGLTKIPGIVGNANSSGDYNVQLAAKLPISILTGTPQEIKLSDKAKRDQINNVSQTQFEKALQIGQAHKPSANTTVNPTKDKKKPVLTKTSGWGAQGGSEVHYDPKTDTLTITSEKMLRTGLKGDEFGTGQYGYPTNPITYEKQTRFGDIPDAKPEFVKEKIRAILNIPGVKEIPAALGSPEYQKMIKQPGYIENTVLPNVAKMSNDLASYGVQGIASNVVVLRKALTDIGLLPQSEVEKTGGGYGQVYSQTSYKGNEIPQELRNIINNKIGVKESFNITESRKRILREIKQPYKLPEQSKQKYTIKPKVVGSNNRVINSDLMKKAEVPSSFKKPEERLWGKYEKEKNTRNSQEKKNELLDHLGASDHAWDWLTEASRNKNNEIMYGNFGGKNNKSKVVRREELKGDALLFIADENGRKESILQSELSIKIANEFEKELFDSYFQEQETMQYDNDPLFKRVAKKIKTEIDYSDKPSKSGYPDQPPPEMVNGWHPEYGKDRGYYNKLDPQSAEAMPLTGNAEIDAKVQKAKRLKKILGKRG